MAMGHRVTTFVLIISIICGYSGDNNNNDQNSFVSERFDHDLNPRRRLYYGMGSYFGGSYDNKDEKEEKGGYYPSIWKKYGKGSSSWSSNSKSSTSKSSDSKSKSNSKSGSWSSKSSKSSDSKSNSKSNSKSSSKSGSSKYQYKAAKVNRGKIIDDSKSSSKSGPSKSQSKSYSKSSDGDSSAGWSSAAQVNMAVDNGKGKDQDTKYKMKEVRFNAISAPQIIDHLSAKETETSSSIFYAKWSFYILLTILVINVMAILYCLFYKKLISHHSSKVFEQEKIGKTLIDDEYDYDDGTDKESSSPQYNDDMDNNKL